MSKLEPVQVAAIEVNAAELSTSHDRFPLWLPHV